MKTQLLDQIEWNTDNATLAKSLPKTILVLDVENLSDNAVDLLVRERIGVFPLDCDRYDPCFDWRAEDRLDNVVVIHAHA